MADAKTAQLSVEPRAPLKITAIITIAFGILALTLPFLAGVTAAFILALNFVIGGALMTIAAFCAERWVGAIGLMALGIVSTLAGILIFAQPLIGLTTVTLFCIIAMLVAGLTKIAWALKLTPGGDQWFLLISGLLSMAVAAMLFSNFPFAATWAFGVLVGLNLLVEGFSLWMFARD